MNYAYVGVLTTESYLLGTLATAECLKNVNSKYPFYVLITDNISTQTEKLLNNFSINTIRKKSIEIPKEIIEKNNKGVFSHWSYTFDKLSIFELTQFDKIVYLDSDIYIRKNIDCLFEKDHMATTPNRKFGPNITPPPELISGLLVIEPQKDILKSFLNILSTISNKRESVGDQDILQEYYTDWKDKTELHLDLKYNAFFTYLDYYTHYLNYSIDDIYVFHFLLANKPWDYSLDSIDDYIKYLNNRIELLYSKYKTKDLLECIKAGNSDKLIITREYMNLLEKTKHKLKLQKNNLL